MPQLFQNLLSLHIVLGLTATALFGYVWLKLRAEEYNGKIIKISSFLGVASLLASWITGGYYYLYFYGTKVKPLVLAGSTPWAHQLIMEAKEHIFLIMPFLGIVLFAAVFGLEEQIKIDSKLKKLLIILSLITAGIGVLMAVMGFIISGSYPKI